MRRRDFFAASAVAGLTFGAQNATSGEGEKSRKQLLELRLYQFASIAKQRSFDDFLAKAAVPALNRAGISPVGVFKMLKDDNPDLKMEADSPNLYILLPHKSPESVLTMIDRLAEDATFVEAAGPVIGTPKSDPAYVRFESSLMLAFDGFPQVEVPTKAATRLFQLRIYESHNDERALRKIAMFNEGGEIAIFRQCGMTPVFFGQTLIGSKLPNLTYMLGFSDKDAQTKAWDTFRKNAEWLKLKADETYADTVSTITNLLLRPAASSQI